MAEFWQELQSWIEERQVVFAWLAGFSVLVFLGSLIAVPIVVIQMRADYFVRTVEEELPRTPLRIVRHALKNVFGYLLILSGLAMLVLPGQGLLTIVFGLSLIDFPGKRRAQTYLVRLNGVRRSIDWMRHKANKPPLEIPE